jgi:hypothetical protein
MKCRPKNYQIGALVKVAPCHGGYDLPEGLPNGAEVKVVRSAIGRTFVEYLGKAFSVSPTNIDSGMEYLVDWKWLDETHPKVVAELQRMKGSRSAGQ